MNRDLVEHHVVSLVKPSTKQLGDIMEARYRALGVPFHCLGATRRGEDGDLSKPEKLLKDGRRFSRVLYGLVRFCIEHKIEALEARCGYGIAFSVAAARLARVPVVVGTDYQSGYWERHPLLGKVLYHDLDVLISDSQYALDCFMGLFDFPKERTQVIQNGLGIQKATKSREEVRKELGIPLDVPMIAKVAQFIPYKGHRYLVEAIPAILKEFPDVYFFLCGFTALNPENVTYLRNRISELDIGHRVVMREWPGEIADVWNAADIQVHSTLLDSSPISIHESMGMGRPTVATRIGGIPELVDDGVTGFIIPPECSNSIAEKVLCLLRDPELVEKMGNAALERFMERHQAHHMSDQLCRLLGDELEKKGLYSGGLNA
jgi:glycosyltransferase involved in cell wall biosynthesis